jgi:hypothetical protein
VNCVVVATQVGCPCEGPRTLWPIAIDLLESSDLLVWAEEHVILMVRAREGGGFKAYLELGGEVMIRSVSGKVMIFTKPGKEAYLLDC